MSSKPARRDKGTEKVRVWWPPTKDKARTGYSGAYWPARVVTKGTTYLEVEYDNGDKERVDPDNIFPHDYPIGFGEETVPLEVGEFVEVFNNSKTDPCAWLGVVDRLPGSQKLFRVRYPFHDSPDEMVKAEMLRRARVWDDFDWKFIEMGQLWQPGEVTSPLELTLLVERDYFKQLAAGGQGGKSAAAAPAAAAAPQDEDEFYDDRSDDVSGSTECSDEGTSGVGSRKRTHQRKPSHPMRALGDAAADMGSDGKRGSQLHGAKRRKPAKVIQA